MNIEASHLAKWLWFYSQHKSKCNLINIIQFLINITLQPYSIIYIKYLHYNTITYLEKKYRKLDSIVERKNDWVQIRNCSGLKSHFMTCITYKNKLIFFQDKLSKQVSVANKVWTTKEILPSINKKYTDLLEKVGRGALSSFD